MNKYAILCVDDEEIILTSLESLLSKNFGEHCTIELAQSGEEGLEIIEEFIEENIELVVIISDWLMPGMKGDEFLEKAHEICPNVFKVILSGYADKTSVQSIKDKEVLSAFINKPWESKELSNLVTDILKKQGCNLEDGE